MAAERSGEVDEMVAELASNAAELSRLLHQTLTLLAELVGGAPATADAGGWAAPWLAPLPHDVLELATLQAQADGVSVAHALGEAMRAHAGQVRPDADDPAAARRQAVRDDARRVRTESRAVKAQSAQAASRAARLEAEASEAQLAGRRRRAGAGRSA
jgi:hypothetical protein